MSDKVNDLKCPKYHRITITLSLEQTALLDKACKETFLYRDEYIRYVLSLKLRKYDEDNIPW